LIIDYWGVLEIYSLTILAIVLLGGSFLLSVVLTGLVRRWSMRNGFVAHPARDRFHQTAVPLGGGIAIFGTIAMFILAGILIVKFVIASGCVGWLGEAVTIHVPGFMSKISDLLIVLICLLGLHLLGLWDDKKHLGPYLKLIVQFAVGLVLAGPAGVRVEFFIESTAATTVLSALWIVLIINAFNFLDNMDGLSAGIAVITSAILLSAAVDGGQVFVGGLAIIFIGTLLGFLVFNFPPAGIFMGDAGSLVVGCVAAILTLRTTYYHEAQSGRWYAVFMPLVVMAVPLYDFISVTVLRLVQGKSPFVGDTQHFSHRLKRRGLTDRQTVLTLYLATLCAGLGATFLDQVNLPGAILIFVQTVMILAIIAVLEMAGKEAGNDKAGT